MYTNKSAVMELPVLREEIQQRSIYMASEDVLEPEVSEDLVEEPFILPDLLDYISLPEPDVRRLAPTDHRTLFRIVHACKALVAKGVLADLALSLEIQPTALDLPHGRLWTRLRSKSGKSYKLCN